VASCAGKGVKAAAPAGVDGVVTHDGSHGVVTHDGSRSAGGKATGGDAALCGSPPSTARWGSRGSSTCKRGFKRVLNMQEGFQEGP
jgi:hypothetical protein